MTIKRRLLIFGTGLLIGTVLSYLLLGWRGCSDWLPERRLRADIELAGLHANASTRCLMACWEAQGELLPTLVDWLYRGEVDWEASGPREQPKRYVFRMQDGLLSAMEVVQSGAAWEASIVPRKPDACACP